MLEFAYLKGVADYEHCHYHYPHIGRTNNNLSRRNLYEA
jgi:hypothetical protein